MIVLVGCGGSSSTETTGVDGTDGESAQEASQVPAEESQDAVEDTSQEGQSIDVDQGLLSVEITIPASFFEGQDMDEVIADAKEDGVGEAVVNDDGSVTYRMSRLAYNRMMDELRDSLMEMVEETKTSGDFPSIQDIRHNRSFTEFTLVVDQEAYENSFDGFAALGLGMAAAFYQVFDGVAPEDIKVTISMQNADTGEVFDSVVYPDALED